jgi:integrase/recombinase XerD
MKLSSAIENYVALRRSLGAVFSVDARILRSFSRALGDIHLEAITPEDCQRFCRGKGLPTRFWERKHQSLRGFFRYLVSREFLVISPFKEPPPRIQPTFRPYIYSHDELERLLEATAQERNPRTQLEPETLRAIVLLLYGAGLRGGKHCGCAVATSIYNTECFQSGTRSSSSRGCSPSEQA